MLFLSLLVSCGGNDGATSPFSEFSTPVAGFSATPTTGKAPLTVAFSDQSTGVISTWSWDFGDGGTSTEQNPSHDYVAAGTYAVSLTVTGPRGSDTNTKADYITVTPFAEFLASPTSGNAPLTVDFTDQSGGGIITSWSWDFGDGGTSTVQNPSHTYAEGTYTVSLTATGPDGSNTNTKINHIAVGPLPPPPVAGFSATPTTGKAPLTVAFDDQSTGVISTWSWDFGDNVTSTVQNPSHDYVAAGTYAVSLTVTGPGGSDTDTKVGYITVTPFAQFSASPISGTAPLTVDFTDQSGGGIITSWSWDFGDNVTSRVQNPSHDYVAAGTYTVSLTVTGPDGSDTNTKVDYINVGPPQPPVAEFSATPTTGKAPLTVAFSDQSTGAINTWSWNFGDNVTSTVQNPSHDYIAAGTYAVSLTVTGPGGSDNNMKVDYITVTPFAEFLASPTSGPEPLTVDFTDQSGGGIITSWSWDFGDNVTSTVQNPSHDYVAAGTYTVSLIVTGPDGSDTNTKVDYIAVNPLPLFTDDFNRADENPLSNGGKWLKYNDASVFNLRVVDNECAHTQSVTAPAAMYWNEAVGQNQYAQARVAVNDDMVVSARVSPSQWDDYEVNIAGDNWRIYKTTNGSAVAVAGPVTSAVSVGDIIRIETTGSNPTLIEGYKNGVLVISYTDSSSPFTSGYVGLGMAGINSRWDDWEGGGLP